MNHDIVIGYLIADLNGSRLRASPQRDSPELTVNVARFTRCTYTARRIDGGTAAPATLPQVELLGGVSHSAPQSFTAAETFTGTAAHRRGLDVTDEAVLSAKVTTPSSTAGTLLELTLYLNDAQ